MATSMHINMAKTRQEIDCTIVWHKLQAICNCYWFGCRPKMLDKYKFTYTCITHTNKIVL